MGALADLLATRREDILQRFEREHQAHFPTEGLSRSAIRDSVPTLLEKLHNLLLRAPEHAANHPAGGQVRQTAEQHRAQRRELGFDDAQIIREYGLLRDCILGLLQETGGALDLTEQRTFHQGLDLAMSDAVTESERGRDEERHEREAERTALL
ncbi:MAG: RsbRD N-terminal domain-containing protein, partial [Archangium sp.]